MTRTAVVQNEAVREWLESLPERIRCMIEWQVRHSSQIATPSRIRVTFNCAGRAVIPETFMTYDDATGGQG